MRSTIKTNTMFNKDKSAQAEKLYATSATLICAGTLLKGDLKSDCDLRIDGTIQGNIDCGAKVVVGPQGVVDGNIHSVQADVSGRLTGHVVASEGVQLRGSCRVQGNITTARLQVDAGAIFNGQSQMEPAGNVVVMKEGETAHAKAN